MEFPCAQIRKASIGRLPGRSGSARATSNDRGYFFFPFFAVFFAFFAFLAFFAMTSSWVSG